MHIPGFEALFKFYHELLYLKLPPSQISCFYKNGIGNLKLEILKVKSNFKKSVGFFNAEQFS